MAGVATLMRRAGMTPHPSFKEEKPKDVMDYCIGAYTFEDCVQGEAIVTDKSGNGNNLQLFNMEWGYEDKTYDLKEGFFNGCLYMKNAGTSYGKIVLSEPLTNFTIIADRLPYAIGSIIKEWTGIVGSGETTGFSPIHLEYKKGSQIYSSSFGKSTSGRADADIIWMNNTHYCGVKMAGDESGDTHDGVIFINKFRGNVTGGGAMKISSLYIFNKNLTPQEIETFIHKYINPAYVMPPIEE